MIIITFLMIDLSGGFSRRRLLKLAALSPWFTSGFVSASDPIVSLERIIALEWRPVELLMALGITPLAVAEKGNYHRWVVEPALSHRVMDVGLRNEPNMELLQRLNPSLFLVSQGFGPDIEPLTRLAPCFASGFRDAQHQPLDAARRDLLLLGQRLNLISRAEQHLLEFDRELDAIAQRLRAYSPRPLLLFSLLDSRRALVMGNNSLFNNVLTRLGLTNAWQEETNFWGSAVVGIERLVRYENVQALFFVQGDTALLDAVSQSALWRMMPFVRDNRWQTLPAVWFYGATFSALRFARLLAQALESQS